jgi:hypothetical protein
VAGCADRTALFQVFEEPFGASFFDGLSGRQDSNLRPPAPKAGALTGLRYRTALFQVFEEPFGASFFDGFLFFERFCFCEEFLFPDDFPIIGFSGKAFMIGVMSTGFFHQA